MGPTFGEQITARRVALLWSKRELATASGLTPDTLRKIELDQGGKEASKRAILAALDAAEHPAVVDNSSTVTQDPFSIDNVSQRENGIGASTGRNRVIVTAATLGVTFEVTYTDAADRSRVLAEVMRELRGSGLTSEGSRVYHDEM